MDEFIKILLLLSLSGTLFLLIIWVLKYFYKKIFSKSWQYYILLLVALRFLLPVFTNYNVAAYFYKMAGDVPVQNNTSITNADTEGKESVKGVENIGKSTEKVNGDKNKEVKETKNNNMKLIRQKIKNTASKVTILNYILKGISFLYNNLFYIWLVFFIIFVTRNIIVYKDFMDYIKATSEKVQDTEILDLLAECGKKLGINKNIQLYFSPAVSSPVLAGFWKACIIIPPGAARKDKLFYVFLHELVHYKRKDMLYKWFIQAVICIHWFNPFAHMLGKDINRACELSCDEAVISILNKEQRRAYGDTLLSFVRIKGSYKKNTGTVTLTEGAAQLKERLGAIMDFKKKPGIIKFLTILVTIIICLGFSLSGVYAAANKENTQKSILKNKDIENMVLKTNPDNYTYTYMQQGYYYNSYILEMGWNLNEEAERAYNNKVNITLEDNSIITVCFDGNVKEYSKDKKVLKAIEGLANSLGDTYPVLEKTLISRVTYVKRDKIPDYARKYYKNKDLIGFTALFPELNKKEQKKYLDKMYKSGRVAFFASVLKYLDNNRISLYKEKASNDGKEAFYYILENKEDF